MRDPIRALWEELRDNGVSKIYYSILSSRGFWVLLSIALLDGCMRRGV